MNAEGKTERILLVSDDEDEEEDLLQLMPESLRVLTTAPSPGVTDAGETRLERLLFSHRQRQQTRGGTGRATRPLSVKFKPRFKGGQEEPRLLTLQRDRRQGTGRVTRPLKINFKKPVMKSDSPEAKPAERPANTHPLPEDVAEPAESVPVALHPATSTLELPSSSPRNLPETPKLAAPATPATPANPAEFVITRYARATNTENPAVALPDFISTPVTTVDCFLNVASKEKSVIARKMSVERFQEALRDGRSPLAAIDCFPDVTAKLKSPATLTVVSGGKLSSAEERAQRFTPVDKPADLEFSVTKELAVQEPEVIVNNESTPAEPVLNKKSTPLQEPECLTKEVGASECLTEKVTEPDMTKRLTPGPEPESVIKKLTPLWEERTPAECVNKDASPAQVPESGDVVEMDDSNTDIDGIVDEVVANIQSNAEMEKEDSQPASVLEDEKMEDVEAPVPNLSPTTPCRSNPDKEEEPQPEVAGENGMENANAQITPPPRTPFQAKLADDEMRRKGKRKAEAQPSPWLKEAGMAWKDGRRCSTRIRSRPLEYWRGERLLYGRVHKTMSTLIGIKHASPLPPKPKRGEKSKTFKVESFVPEQYEHLVKLAAL